MIGIIHVCTSCQDRDLVRRRAGDGTSDALIKGLREQLATLGLDDWIAIAPIACLGPCGNGVRIAVTGVGRWSWLFQDLQPETDLTAFGTFLQAWHDAPEGLPEKGQRPACLVRKTIGRTPPTVSTMGDQR